jgi:uncharacterized protein (TIGR00297 family)
MQIVQAVSTPESLGGMAAALLIAAGARALGGLTSGGMVAAVLVGGGAAIAGWQWATMLVFFFLTSTALSNRGREEKLRLSGGRLSKPHARDAVQVCANGGVFVAAALAFRFWPNAAIAAAAAGALAAATSDTWATEVGMLSPEPPRSIVTREIVPPGSSGGISPAGSMAGVAGALVMAMAAAAFHVAPRIVGAVALGGIVGMLADSFLGATVQSRRRCARCDVLTERAVHSCGTPTAHAGGWRWLDNDGVNFLATLAGAGVACATRALMNLV